MGVRDLFSGREILLQANVNRHHILPRAQFPERKRADADTVANIAFISGEVNRNVGAASPDVYLKGIDPEVLKSQCIPLDENLWRIDRAEEFWHERRSLVTIAFNDFLRKMLPGRRL
jgi:hypothetical protein